jgi:hypothetical protein
VAELSGIEPSIQLVTDSEIPLFHGLAGFFCSKRMLEEKDLVAPDMAYVALSHGPIEANARRSLAFHADLSLSSAPKMVRIDRMPARQSVLRRLSPAERRTGPIFFRDF